jgi:hypothetical protein
MLRFCLCTWLGVALLFNVAVLGVLESLLYDPPPISKFSQPQYFLPSYFGLALALLGGALLCAFGSLWSARIGLVRRWAMLLLVALALAMVAADYLFVYRGLVEIFAATTLRASDVVTLFQFYRLLKRAVLGVSIVAAILAVWPESDADLPARRHDPAL